MIAPWLLETLSREWNWRAALRRIAGELASRSPSPLSVYPRDHALACADVARALEHVEPDRRFAIASYQQAGPEHDDGRALALAIEAGWWPVVSNLAMRERTATGSLEAMVWEARALIDTGERERADKLLPITPSDLRLASLRAELSGGNPAVLEQWVLRAQALEGSNASDASEAFLIAARQARALGSADWVELLRLAAEADPGHAGVVAMMIEQSFGDGRRDSRSLLEHLRQRLSSFEERGDLTAWCDATRLAAMRLWLGSGAERHRGLARRLVAAALERAYREGVTEISGHLAMWAVLDEAATVDQTRTELLGLVVSALDAPLPAADRIWLAALGAEICAQASNLNAAHAYAAVVVELAPEHPVVRDYYAGTVAAAMPEETQLEEFRDALLKLDVQPWQELQIEEVAPLSMDEIGLAPGVVSAEQTSLAIESALESAVPVMDGDEVLEVSDFVDQWWQRSGVAIGTGTEPALEVGPVGPAMPSGAVRPVGATGMADVADRGGGRVHARAETVESGPVGTRRPRVTPAVATSSAVAPSAPVATSAAVAPSSAVATSPAVAPEPSVKPPERATTARAPKQAARSSQSQPVATMRSELDDGWGEPTPARSRRGSRSLESIPPILEPAAKAAAAAVAPPTPAAATPTPAAAPPAAVEEQKGGPRLATDVVATSPVRLPTGVVATQPVLRSPTDAIPTSQLRLPTGVVATSPIAKAGASPAAAPSSSPTAPPTPGAVAPSAAAASKILPARLATSQVATAAASSPVPRVTGVPAAPSPASPPSLIPGAVRSALSGGGKPKPLPPVPPPPSARPRARRVTIAMDLRMSVGGRELSIQSRDVSSSGLFAVTNADLPIGAVIDGELSVPSSGLSEESHPVRLRVIRRSKIGYGCEIVEPSAELAAALAKLTPPDASAAEPSAPTTTPALPALPAVPPVRGAT